MALPRLVDVSSTRAALHAVAEKIAAEQFAANQELALGATPDGFATGPFLGDGAAAVRLRVAGAEVVREQDGAEVSREPIDGVDASAGAVLVAWWSLGDEVLRNLDAGADTLSPVILWPEHFDIAVTVTTSDDRSINLGFSPGDEFSAEPYVYAGPWVALEGPFWNAPFGAYRTYSQIADGEPATNAAAFLADAREVFRAG
ncbi:MAG TPA: hypothetical protein VJ831_11305 [Jatrophihabitantaceae bacterium]|nr:hypothetical protein [Jatrophihabitantaceae bacterium]